MAERKRYAEKLKERNLSGYFVGIDAEGCDTGITFTDPDEVNERGEIIRNGDHYREHRAFLWGAGNDDKMIWLTFPTAPQGPLGRDQAQLSSLEIAEWICDLPRQFPKETKFIRYGLSYDMTQLLKDLPFEVAWEIQYKKPFRERSYPPDRQRPASLNHVAIWRTVRPDGTQVAFAINSLKGKWLKIGRCANPDKIFKSKSAKSITIPASQSRYATCSATSNHRFKARFMVCTKTSL